MPDFDFSRNAASTGNRRSPPAILRPCSGIRRQSASMRRRSVMKKCAECPLFRQVRRNPAGPDWAGTRHSASRRALLSPAHDNDISRRAAFRRFGRVAGRQECRADQKQTQKSGNIVHCASPLVRARERIAGDNPPTASEWTGHLSPPEGGRNELW